jgi:LEA14-like dessication related protein
VTARELQVTGVSARALSLRLKADVLNPNSFSMSAQRVTGTLTLSSGQPLGDVSIEKPVALPSKVTTSLDIPFDVSWQGAMVAGTEAMSGKDLKFTLDGKVAIGSEGFNVDVPYKVSGEITQLQIRQALSKSLIPMLSDALR